MRGPLRRGDQEAPPHARRQDRTRESGECRRAVHADVGHVVLGAALETGGGAAAAIHALRRAAGEDAHAERLRGDGRDLAPRARRRRAEAIDETPVRRVRPILVAMDVEREAGKVQLGGRVDEGEHTVL